MEDLTYMKFPKSIGLIGRSVGIAVLAAIVGIITGCGSGGRTVDAPTRAKATASAAFTIKWPKRPAGYSRLIPLASNSIDVRLTSADGTVVLGDALLARPSAGGTSTTTFNNLPLGAALLSATAYPNADGTGVALATAQEALTLVAGTTPVSLTMASTIQTLTVSPATTGLKTRQTKTLLATATDTSGNVVLTTPGKISWTSSNIGAASVDASGNVTGVAAGTAKVTATETESGVSGVANVTVTALKSISFANPVSIAVPAPGDVLAADLDGDGNVDIAVSSGGNVVVFWGHGDGTFTSGVTVYTGAGDSPDVQAAADLNNDGKLDLICVSNSNKVYILMNNGKRTFTSQSADVGSSSVSAVAADFNGDGFKDIAVLTSSQSNNGFGGVVILTNHAGTTFSQASSFGVYSIPEGIAVGDLNRDGKQDLVCTFAFDTIGESGFQVFFGNGNGTFGPATRYNTGSANVPLPRIADFNQDGILDIGVDNYSDNNIGVLLGNGDGTFGSVSTYFANGLPLVWQVADFDSDGYPDVEAPNAGGSTFTVLQNLGDGTFAPELTFQSGGSNTRTSSVADFNNDGKPDIVLGCESSNSIEILINTSK